MVFVFFPDFYLKKTSKKKSCLFEREKDNGRNEKRNNE